MSKISILTKKLTFQMHSEKLLYILFFSETFGKLAQPTNQINIKHFQS